MAELKPYVFEETRYGLIAYLERISEEVKMHPRATGAVVQAMERCELFLEVPVNV